MESVLIRDVLDKLPVPESAILILEMGRPMARELVCADGCSQHPNPPLSANFTRTLGTAVGKEVARRGRT